MPLKRSLLTLSLIVLLVSNVFAATQVWEFAGWSGGGCFPNIEFDVKNEGRVYLTSDVAGIWRSDNLGEDWYSITNGLTNLMVAQLAVAPSDSNHLYASTNKGLFASKDAGQSWEPASNQDSRILFKRPANYKSIAIHPEDSSKVCVGTAKGQLFCSRNAGRRWQELDPKRAYIKESNPITVVLFNDAGTFLYVGGKHGLVTYDYASKKWHEMNESFENVTDLAWETQNPEKLYIVADHKLWISSDGARSWQVSSGEYKGHLFRIAVIKKEDGNQVIAASNHSWKGNVLRSNDDGASWEVLTKEIVPDLERNPTWAWADRKGKTNALKLSPHSDQIMFRTDWWGVWRSDDGGETWVEKINGAANTVASDIVVDGDNIYVASMDNGLLMSKNGGKLYKMLFPEQGYDDEKIGHIWRVALTPQRRIIATSSPWNKKVNQVIIKDKDREKFELIRAGLPEKRPKIETVWGEGYPRALAIDSQNPNNVYLGIDGEDGGGLFMSRDGGKAWQRSEGQPGSLRIYKGLAVDPLDSKRIYWGATGKKGGVYVSEDQGQTWQYTLKSCQWIFDLKVDKFGTVYAAGDCGGAAVYVSRNQGKAWRLLQKFKQHKSAESIAIAQSDANNIAVSTVSWSNDAPQKIFFTNNAGEDWQDITGDLPDGAGAAAMSFNDDGSQLYAARYAGSVWRSKVS